MNFSVLSAEVSTIFGVIAAVGQVNPVIHTILQVVNSLQSLTPESLRAILATTKARTDTLNNLALVGAFIAAVQAQMISFTYQQNNNSIQRATNAISFIGLFLDVLGTCLGLLTASQSQRRHSQISAFLIELEQWKLEVKTREEKGDTQGAEELHEQWRGLEEDFRTINPGFILFGRLGGIAPIASMVFGVICFVVALCYLVKETQPHSVWVASISVAVSASFILSVDHILARAGSKLRERRRMAQRLSQETGMNQQCHIPT